MHDRLQAFFGRNFTKLLLAAFILPVIYLLGRYFVPTIPRTYSAESLQAQFSYPLIDKAVVENGLTVVAQRRIPDSTVVKYFVKIERIECPVDRCLPEQIIADKFESRLFEQLTLDRTVWTPEEVEKVIITDYAPLAHESCSVGYREYVAPHTFFFLPIEMIIPVVCGDDVFLVTSLALSHSGHTKRAAFMVAQSIKPLR